MNQKVLDFNKSQQTNKVPPLRVGDIVRVHKRIQEGNKERIQVFKGMIIAVKGKQSSSPTITVRRESSGVGVEATFPIHLPTIEKIDLLRHSKVRRSKLYYMRERSGRAAKMKAQDLNEKEEALLEQIKKDTRVDDKKVEKKDDKKKKEEKSQPKAQDKKEEPKQETKEPAQDK